MPKSAQNPAIATYNQDLISGWRQESSDLAAAMNRERAIIGEANSEISRANSILAEVSPQVSDLDRQIRHANERYERRREREHASHAHHEGGLTHQLLDMARDIAGDVDVNDLKNRRSPLRDRERQAESALSSARRKQNRAEDEWRSLNERNVMLLKSIEAGSQFLSNLSDHPETFCGNMRTRIINMAREYEKNYPSGQAIQTRLFLYRIEEQIDAIMNAANQEIVDNNRLWQWRFSLLNGYLWDIWHLVKDQDATLANEITTLLQEMHIEEGHTLPDAMRFEQSSSQIFGGIKPSNPLYNVTEQQLVDIETHDYRVAYSTLQTDIAQGNQIDPFNVKVHSLLEDTNEQRITKPESKTDYKLYANILRQTHAVKHSSEPEVISSYAHLANHVAGKPSTLKKVGGVMLGILGVALVVCSTLALIASFGTSAPLSCITGIVGTSLLAKGLAGAGIGLGVTSMLGGMGLFGSGMRKGLSKKVHDVEMAVVMGSSLDN